MILLLSIIFFFLYPANSFSGLVKASEYSSFSLYKDLETLETINKKINDELPLLYNYNAQTGYFLMPSARAGKEGNLHFCYSSVPPYSNYNVSFQFFSFVELSANYRTFCGVLDSGFGHLGFGDKTDRAANIKVNLLKRSDCFNYLPEIAFGLNDFMGSKFFRSWFIAATQSFLKYNLELTGGWATGRMQGFYGALGWTPFRQKYSCLKNLSLLVEYDCNDYKNCPCEHPLGRKVKHRINYGAYYTLFDLFHFSVSSLRGSHFAFSAGLNYNIGQTKGVFAKVDDPKYYTFPIDNEPIGLTREEKEFSCQLALALQDQGFALYSIRLYVEDKNKVLWLKIVNLQYRIEKITRERIENLLGALLPSDIKKVIVAIESEGVLCQEYVYRADELKRYFSNQMGEYELEILSPMKEVENIPNDYDSRLLYFRKKSIWTATVLPKVKTYFGNAKGKFKYDIGLMGGIEGYLFNDIYYNLQASGIFFSSSGNILAKDTLNPSKIINVRSDFIRYYQGNSFHFEKAFLQKSWNLSKGCFCRLSAGCFEVAYGGAALEMLYYPIDSFFALGVEVCSLFKRTYSGWSFTDKVYKFDGTEAKKVNFIGLQYFLDVYYQFKPLNLDFKFSLGQFLAKDKGIKIQMGKTFSSGLTVYLWYTFTNAVDIINGSRYFDKGVGFSFPLDIFLTKSSKTRIGYSMSAWLRDIGARVISGKELYPTLYYERQNY